MALKSSIERSLDLQLKSSGLAYSYEKKALPYTLRYNYIPDFYIPELDIYIEAKGWLRRTDQAKMRAVKLEHPDLDIRFVFQELDKKVQNGRMTNQQWAEKYGFPYAEGSIPEEWLIASNPQG